MVWNEIGQWVISTPQVLIPVGFTSRLAIKATEITNLRPTWDWASFFYQYLEFDPIGLARIDRKINIPTREPVIFIPDNFQPNYSLKFIKAGWIPSLRLTIYEDSMPLNFEPVINIPAPVVNIPSTTAATATSITVAVVATSTTLLPSNANRKKLIIANNGNQDLYIDFDAAASVSDHCVKIPKITASGFIANYTYTY